MLKYNNDALVKEFRHKGYVYRLNKQGQLYRLDKKTAAKQDSIEKKTDLLVNCFRTILISICVFHIVLWGLVSLFNENFLYMLLSIVTALINVVFLYILVYVLAEKEEDYVEKWKEYELKNAGCYARGYMNFNHYLYVMSNEDFVEMFEKLDKYKKLNAAAGKIQASIRDSSHSSEALDYAKSQMEKIMKDVTDAEEELMRLKRKFVSATIVHKDQALLAEIMEAEKIVA